MKGFPDLPPIWLAGFVLIAWFLAAELPLLIVFGPLFQLLGLVTCFAGFAAITWSALWFWRKKTTIEPHEAPKALITEGPYRYSRNPIYLGLVMILTGYVLWLGALSAVLLPGLFISVLTLRFIQPEEARLVEVFGAEAERYLQATRRWL